MLAAPLTTPYQTKFLTSLTSSWRICKGERNGLCLAGFFSKEYIRSFRESTGQCFGHINIQSMLGTIIHSSHRYVLVTVLQDLFTNRQRFLATRATITNKVFGILEIDQSCGPKLHVIIRTVCAGFQSKCSFNCGATSGFIGKMTCEQTWRHLIKIINYTGKGCALCLHFCPYHI